MQLAQAEGLKVARQQQVLICIIMLIQEDLINNKKLL